MISMAKEKGQEQVSAVTETTPWMKKWTVPAIERQEYVEFVKKGKSPFNLGEVLQGGAGLPEEELTVLYLWWRKFDDAKALMVRFALAASGESLPLKEKKRAAKAFAPVRKTFETL